MNTGFSRLRFITLILIVGAGLVLTQFAYQNVAKAEAIETDWSWTKSPPVTFSTEVADMPSDICPKFETLKQVDGKSGFSKICMTTGDSLSFGTFYDSEVWSYRSVIGFRFDARMFKLSSSCNRYDSCLYLPGSDTLVMKQYLINGLVRSLVVLKNFASRLTPHVKVGINPTLEYSLNESNPDYVFKSDYGYAWPIGGFGASDNGKWLAIEFRQRGIGLLDIETLQMKRISELAFSYGTGYDPSSQLAVSNDGNHIAVAGLNAYLTIFDVDSNCGELATDEKMLVVGYMKNPCRKASFDSEEFLHRFFLAINPKFDEEGGELTFYAGSYDSGSRYVSLRAAGYGGYKLDYLALGDSFSSGEGETDDGKYLSGTNDEYEKCHVSIRSYPYLIASWSRIDPTLMKSVACSGAVAGDVVGIDKDYWGQGNRLGEENLGLSRVDKIYSQTQAKNSFIPGRVHQVSFVAKYQPKVITIGIGGNDAGFMAKLSACISLGTCDSAGTDQGKEQTAVEIKNLFGKLVETYKSVHAASPNSRIYVVGYPKTIDNYGDCGAVLGYMLDDTEKYFMNEGVIYLNQVIAAAARSAGVKYLDIQDSYGDNVLCGDKKPSAMNPVVAGDDINPINDSDWFRVIGSESFHPNSLGHSMAAGAIVGSIGNILEYDYCRNGAIICPDQTVIAPEPSAYWGIEYYHDYPTQQIASIIFDKPDAVSDNQKTIELGSNSLMPNSAVDLVITSNPVSLGHFTASSDGSLAVDIDLPVDIEEGYHTVHLYGTSYSGQSIELYQVIRYDKADIVPSQQATGQTAVLGASVDTGKDIDVVINQSLVAPVIKDNHATVTDYKSQDNPDQSLVIIPDKGANSPSFYIAIFLLCTVIIVIIYSLRTRV